MRRLLPSAHADSARWASRLLAFCVVAGTIGTAFVLAQDGATGTIVVTSQQYPSLVFPGSQYQIRGVTSDSQMVSHVIATVRSGLVASALANLGSKGYLATDQAMPNRVVSLGSVAAGTGSAGFSGDGGEATAADLSLSTSSLVERSGIAVAADGTIYIADTNNGTIRAVASKNSSEPGIIRSVAGKWGPRSNVTLVEPMGIAVDRAGDLYVADHSAGIVAVYSKATEQLRILAHVASPASIAVTADGTKLFVASPETGGVFVIPTNTRVVSVLPEFPPVAAGSDSFSVGPCADVMAKPQMANAPAAEAAAKTETSTAAKVCPAGLAVDGRGNLFVSDAKSGQILRIDAISGKASIAVTGVIAPGDIAFDAQGNLFIAEQGRSRILAIGGLGAPISNLTLSAPAPFPAPCPQVTNPYTFCNEPQGGTTQSAAFTLSTGVTAVSGIAITPAVPANPPTLPPTNFTTVSTTCTATLAANSSCTINVTFTPQTTAAIAGTLAVTDNAGDSATLNLAGTGDDFQLSLASGQTNEVTVKQGGTATFMAQVTTDGVFGANGEKVTFVCPKTMPLFSTCAFNPCPVSVTPSSTTAFNIVIVTSSKQTQAPPVPNPCGGTSSNSRAMRAPRFAMVLTPKTAENFGGGSGGLAALIVIAGALVITSGAVSRRRRTRAPWIFALAGVAVLIFAGCHHSSGTNTATPIGVSGLTITANALDANGNPINAARSLTFSIDVVTGP